MLSDSGGVVPEGTHVEATCQDSTADEGGKDRRGGESYLCGFLTPGAEYGEMPGSGLSGSSA